MMAAVRGIKCSNLCVANRLLHITGPLSIESTLWFVCSSMMSLAFVGHLGKLPLAACVLANSVYNISGYSLVVGMAAAMNSLSGQVLAPSSPKAGRSVEPLSLVTAPWDHRPHFA